MSFNRLEWQKIDVFAKKYKAVQYLGGKCEMCGEDNVLKLEFHHENDDKETTMWALRGSRWSLIENEIKKCKLLCRNCHGELHYGGTSENSYKFNKRIFLEYKGISGCEKCGYNRCSSSLDFHHINSDDKDFMLGQITTVYKSIYDLTTQIENELNKCMILCKNCHMIEHTDAEFFEEYKEEIIRKSLNLKEKQSKLDREKIRKMYSGGMRQVDIANYFNSSKSTVCEIIRDLKIKKPIH